MAFTQKLIDVQFDLANGQFDGGGNSMTVTGLRVESTILTLGGGSGQAEFAIYGLPLKLINQLTAVGTEYNKMYDNGISVRAGSTEEGMTVVWSGKIATAFFDGQNMPEACLRVTSTPGAVAAIKPVAPTTLSGPADAAGLVQKLAGQMGFQFENAGVTAKLVNPYYPGTAWTQMLHIARDAGFDVVADRGTIAAVPPGKARSGDVPLISADTGMVTYPIFQQAWVSVRALFNPAVKPYGKIQIKSDIEPANGMWIVNRLEYELDSMVPQGRWFMNIQGYRTGSQTTP